MKNFEFIGNITYSKLLEENIKFTIFNSDFAEKVGAELTAAGVKWSGKVDSKSGRTTLAVNNYDSAAFAMAVSFIKKSEKQTIKERLNEKKAES